MQELTTEIADIEDATDVALELLKSKFSSNTRTEIAEIDFYIRK